MEFSNVLSWNFLIESAKNFISKWEKSHSQIHDSILC